MWLRKQEQLSLSFILLFCSVFFLAVCLLYKLQIGNNVLFLSITLSTSEEFSKEMHVELQLEYRQKLYPLSSGKRVPVTWRPEVEKRRLEVGR